MKILSVADHLLYTALKTPYPRERVQLASGARDLVKCKRLSYDMNALEAVKRSRETISSPEILSHFRICKLPFNYVWLEGPHCSSELARREKSREGYILRSLPDEGFSIQIYSLIPGASEMKAMMRHHRRTLDALEIENVIISNDPALTITVNSKRIDLDDENLIKILENKKKMFDSFQIKGMEADDKINVLFETADFIARMIVIMNSRPLGIAPADTKDTEEIKNDRKIQSALTLRVPTTVDIRPITIDLARIKKEYLETLRSNEPRDNQGITSVCGHMCYPKTRKPYWMPPHDRSKLLPGDNRSAERQYTSTEENLRLAIQGGAPTRVLEHAKASLKKFDI